ncbi:MAG: hypothetical protein QOE92_1312 [Chloroflexota bacterium]|jgi:hypothetical protein|nr:hypothetical protein [Chloroflexota bacterium]
MSFVVIRSDRGSLVSKAFRDAAEADKAAREWAASGSRVQVIDTRGRPPGAAQAAMATAPPGRAARNFSL